MMIVLAFLPLHKKGKNFHATLLQKSFATERKTHRPQHMKNTLECRDFWMEVIVPVLLGQETPTNEQVYV